MSWLYVGIWTLLIYLTIPLARTIQSFVTEYWDRTAFSWVVVAAVALGIISAAWFLLRHRRRVRGAQYISLAAVAALYLYGTYYLRHAPEEALHFVQYGVLGLLVYRALTHHVRDATIYLSAAALCGLLGTWDEIIQWVTPRRYWDFRDVYINFIGGGLIQLAIAFGMRPSIINRGWPMERSVRLFARLYIAQLILLGLCVSNTLARIHWYADRIPALEFLKTNASVMVEYGYRHEDPDIGVFFSRFTLEDLKREDDAHAEEYARILQAYHAPETYGEFLRIYPPAVNPFLHEARVHLWRRDHYRGSAWQHGEGSHLFAYHYTVAYREHLIVERYFSNTYHRTRYRMADRNVQEMRDWQLPDEPYVSAVSAHMITTYREQDFWLMILIAVIALEGSQRYYAFRRRE